MDNGITLSPEGTDLGSPVLSAMLGVLPLSAGLAAAAAIGKTIVQYTFYQSVVAREIKRSLKPLSKQLEELQASVEELNRQCSQLQKQLAQQKGTGRKER